MFLWVNLLSYKGLKFAMEFCRFKHLSDKSYPHTIESDIQVKKFMWWFF